LPGELGRAQADSAPEAPEASVHGIAQHGSSSSSCQPDACLCNQAWHTRSARQIAAPTCRQRAQHAQCSGGNAVHASQAVAGVDGAANGDGGDDAGLVAEGQAKDDVGGRASAAGVSHVLHPALRRKEVEGTPPSVSGGTFLPEARPCNCSQKQASCLCVRAQAKCAKSAKAHLYRLVAVGGEVLGLQADEQAAPQASGHGDEQVPIATTGVHTAEDHRCDEQVPRDHRCDEQVPIATTGVHMAEDHRCDEQTGT